MLQEIKAVLTKVYVESGLNPCIKRVEHLYNNLRAGQKFSVKYNCSSAWVKFSTRAKDHLATGKHN